MKYKIIKSIDELKKYAKTNCEAAVLLNGGLKSVKIIEWNENKKMFFIINCIDDTKQKLTEKDIFNKSKTLIGKAIKKGALRLEELNVFGY